MRLRLRVAHVAGCGQRTFHEHALEDVERLIAIIERIEADRDAQLRIERAELDSAAEHRIENERDRHADELKQLRKKFEGTVDAAIAKLREVAA